MATDMGESEGLKGRLVEVERECASLQQDLAEVQVKLRSSEEDKENLSNMTQELDKELHQLQASLESSNVVYCSMAGSPNGTLLSPFVQELTLKFPRRKGRAEQSCLAWRSC